VSEESVLLCRRRLLREGLDFNSFRGGFTVHIEFRLDRIRKARALRQKRQCAELAPQVTSQPQLVFQTDTQCQTGQTTSLYPRLQKMNQT
jgi:hypothetical protein